MKIYSKILKRCRLGPWGGGIKQRAQPITLYIFLIHSPLQAVIRFNPNFLQVLLHYSCKLQLVPWDGEQGLESGIGIRVRLGSGKGLGVWLVLGTMKVWRVWLNWHWQGIGFKWQRNLEQEAPLLQFSNQTYNVANALIFKFKYSLLSPRGNSAWAKVLHTAAK